MNSTKLLAATLLLAGLQIRAATFVVTSTADSGPGSLRQAIADAEANEDFDEIHFNIPPGGVQVITPVSAYPAIQHPVWIKGETQPGYAEAGTPQIEIDGRLIVAYPRWGLCLQGGRSAISALALHSFPFVLGDLESGHQIFLKGGGTNLIYGCYAGLTAAGLRPATIRPALSGIHVLDSADNQIDRKSVV